MTYEELYAWIRAAFEDREFNTTEFRTAFPSPDPAKVLFDLRRRGFVESEAPGRFRATRPEKWVRSISANEKHLFGIAERAGLPYAYSHDTAVEIWTEGGYWAGFTRGFRPIHVQVRREDTQAWKRYFRSMGARFTVDGDRRTLYGVVHVLHPTVSVHAALRGGVHVVPRDVAYKYASERSYAYGPALAALRP